MQTITIKVDPEKNENFKSCDDCVHSNDGENICRLRCCVHAFYRLKECYYPKRGKAENEDKESE